MKEMRRVLALVLCLVMLIGIVPAAAFATESEAPAEESGYTDLGTKTAAEGNEQQDPLPEEIQQLVGAPADAPALAADGEKPIDAALFFSDLHTNANNYKDADIKRILGGLKNFGMKFSTVNSVGDAFSNNENKYTGYTSTITKSFQEALGYSDFEMYYVWTDHDRGADIDNFTGLLYGDESTNYYLYTISMSDMSSSERYGQPSTFTESKLSDFTAAVEAMDHSKPLFILSHMPLHDRRNDNQYADEWYGVISAAAEKMDIAFFWGHNHTQEPVSEQAAYYVAKNGSETMMVEGMSKAVTPNFTYLCAGYMSPASTGYTASTTRQETVVAVTLYEDQVVYTLYDEDGAVSGDFALNETVTRDHAAPAVTLTSIAVTTEPTTVEYTVGDTFSAEGLVVTGTYSDGTTASVTGYTLSEVDMTTAGEKEVTVTYEGKTATFKITVRSAEPTVNTVECWDDTKQVTVEATGLGLTAVAATNVTGENGKCDEIFTEYGYVAFDIALTGLVEGESVKYSISVVADLDTTNLELYYIDENGDLIPVEYKLTSDELGNAYVEFTADHDGTFVYGSPAVPEGYVLTSLALANIPRDMFLNGSLDLLNAEITATYTKEGAEDFVRKLTAWDFDETNFSGYDVAAAGAQTVVFTFEGMAATYEINVWGDSVTAEGVTVALDVSSAEYGVIAVTVAESTNAHVADAVANVMSNYVAYDISLVYESGYAATNDAKTVTLPIPKGVVNPVVYYVSDNGYNVVDMNATVNEDGTTVSFQTTHFSTYVVGEGTTITVPDEETATGSGTTTTTQEKEVYVLVSTPTAGKQYIIVNRNAAGSGYALKENTTTGSSVTVNAAGNGITAPYIETTDKTIMWNVTSGLKFQSENNLYYLYYNSNRWSLGFDKRNSTDWNAGTNSLHYNGNWDMYLVYSNNAWTTSWESSSVYFYEKQTVTIETTTTVTGTYSIAGTDETVAAIKDATIDLSSTLIFTANNNATNPEMDPSKLSYAVYDADNDTTNVNTGDPLGVISKIDGNVVTLSGKVGKALVKVTYESEFGTVTDYITVTASTPDHYSIQLHKVNLTVAENVTEDNFSERTYYTFNFTTGFYNVATAYVEGTTYYTLPVIQGDAITAPIALKGVEKDDSYSIWAVVKAHATSDDTEGVDVGTLGDALSWTVSDESIATINTETGVITFTGDNYGTFDVTVAFHGADGKTITSTITISATESLYVVPGDGTNDFPEYPNEGAVRFDKTATAVGNYSETGIAMVELSMTGVPYSTGNRLDVVLMLDRSSSMYKSGVQHRISSTVEATKAFIKNIVINEDGTFNNNRILVLDFLGGNLDSSAGGGSNHKFQCNQYTSNEENGYQVIGSQAELDALLTKVETDFKGQTSLYGTEYAQGLEKCYDALRNSKSDGNQQFCVFMSDGIPNYMMGETTHFKKTNDIVATFDVTNRTAANGTATRNATKYEYEKYSTLMKNDGVTVFTVGLGLKNTNSAWNGTSKEVCEQVANMLLNDISGPAGETAAQRDTGNTVSKLNKYFFSVADDNAAADMKDVFGAISQKIVEAARDVRVEDKVGNNYSLNFSIPGYGTDNAVSADALDGLTEFYIRAVEYQLNADKERTGDPTVLENFTFNADGTFKSHTVDGVACANCSHVEAADGVITAIDGTYFDYTRKQETDEDGKPVDAEYLNWEAEKLTNTELALQYFAYLDNSTGVDAENQVPAGTYYTNEYATLTYKNYKGNEVQREFPIPQMTWNGAQVSYVFYLVNDAGQPVNRAGRVVPFAEAVYVTDVHTTEVIWNDLEQAAGLEAEHLAENLVPDVYALYDDDASYQIHVYEDEKEVNLNNHFVIGGDVTDSYNKTEHAWTNAKTTYVFNNKSDATKYNEDGAYIANDGNDTTVSNSYYCKSATIEGATYETYVDEAGVTAYKVTGLGSGYQKVEGETQVQANVLPSTTGATIIGGYAYYVDENGAVYTVVQKSDGTEVEKGFDFHNTTVAFAVVWKPALEPDTVVVDYGLDVVIDVIKNDNMAAGVVGVRDTVPAGVTTDGTYTRNEATTVTTVDVYIDTNNDADGLKELKIGTAKVENLNQVRFSLDKTNGMQFSEPAVFYYEADVNYYDTNNELKTRSMYSSVTVIPATTVYYEDEYVDLITYTKGYSEVGKVSAEYFDENVLYIKNGDTYVRAEDYAADTVYYSAYTPNAGWAHNSVAATQTQDVDRPGADKMGGGYDADNIYGSDSAYEKSSTFSLDNSAWTTVTADSYAAAEFEFYGTGFDVISVTSGETGSVVVRIYEPNGNGYKDTYYKSVLVDSYYGYTYKDGEWVPVASENDNALYQIPVIKIDDLPYNRYKAVIMSTYMPRFDHDNDGSYNFYLDAIRIYDPCGLNEVVDDKGTEDKGDDVTVGDVYAADGEFAPKYEELRNKIIGTPALGAFVEVENIKTFVEGVMYFTEDAHGNFSEVTKGAEPVPGIVYYTVTATAAEVSEFAKDVDYFTKVENGDFIQVAESEAYNAQKNYYTFVEATIDTFTEGVTYYTEVDHIYTEVPADAVYDSEKTYYTVKYEVVEIDAFAEGVTYYTETNGIYAEVPVDAVYDSEKTYYTVTYEMAEIKPFVEGVTYYTEEDGIYTEVPADAVYDSEKAYYTAQHEKVEDAFAEDVTYYTKDIAYIKTAHVAPVERTTYYTLTPEEAKISQFESGATYFAVDKNDRFTIVTANETPKEDVIYYTMNSGEELEGAVFLTPTFVDGNSETTSIADYTNYGPNNEVYLAAGQAVAAKLKDSNQVSSVHLGIKSVGGNASVEVYGIDSNGVETAAVMEDLSTATDMYYDITNLIGRVIVIRNSGSSGIVSITNVKTAYEKVKSPTNPANEEDLTPNSVNAAAETEASMFTVDAETLKLALLSLSEPIKVEQPDAPEGGEPGGNEPGGEPEGGEPGGNEPGGEPEGGEPGGNEPGGEPEGGEPGGNEPGGEPEGGEPGGNEPGGEPEGGEPSGDAPQDPAPSEPVPEETEPEEKESIEETIQDIVEIIRDIIGIIGGMFRGWF